MPPVNPNVRTKKKLRVEIQTLPNNTKTKTIVSVETTHDKKTGNLISSNVTTATYNSALPLEMAALSPKAGKIYPKLKDEPLLTNITKKTTEAKPVAKPSPAVTPAVTPVVVPPPPPAVTPAVTPAVIPPPPPAVTPVVTPAVVPPPPPAVTPVVTPAVVPPPPPAVTPTVTPSGGAGGLPSDISIRLNDKEKAKSVVASIVSKKSNKPSVIKTPVKPLSKASSIAISGLGNMPAPSSIKSGKRSIGLALDGDDELNLGDNIIPIPKKLKSNPSSASATSMSQFNQHNLEAMLGGSNTSKHITGGSILGSIIEGGSDIGGLDLNSMSSASKAKLAQIIANRSSRSSAIGSKLGLREDTSNINLDNIQGLADDNLESAKGLQDLLSNISGFSGGQPQLSPSQIQALNALNALNTNRSNRSSQVKQRSRQTSMAGSGLNGIEKASSINVNDIIQGLADDNPESVKGLQDLLSNISGFSGENPQLSPSQIQALNALNALNTNRSNRSSQVQQRSRQTSMAGSGLNGVEKASSINVNDIIQGLADDNPESAKGLQDLLSNISGFSGEKPQLSLSQIQALNALNALNGSRSNRSRQVQPRSNKTSMAGSGRMSKTSDLAAQLNINEEQLKLLLAATSKAPSSVSKKNLARGNLSSGRRTNLTSNGAISKSVHYTPAPHEMIDPANESDSSDMSTMVSIGKDVGNIKPRSNPRTPSRVSVNESVQLWKNQVVKSKAPSFVSGLTNESGSTFSLPHNKVVKFKINGSKIRIAPEPEESIAPSNSASNK